MMLSSVLPPSPAISICDSLADIDDLDAFLEAQGTLSHFPTPPLKTKPVVLCVEVPESDDDDQDQYDVEGLRIATILADEACDSDLASPRLVELVYDFLVHANLPVEIVALALNILTKASVAATSLHDYAPELLVICSLALATTYTSDHPPRTSYWASEIADDAFTSSELDSIMLNLLSSLDWRLHDLCSAERLECGMLRLQSLQAPSKTIAAPSPVKQKVMLEKPLRLIIDSVSACWSNGQLTPTETSPSSALDEPKSSFLRLL